MSELLDEELEDEGLVPLFTTAGEWAQHGNDYSPSTRANKVGKLPGGVYNYHPTLGGWFLRRIANTFEFPFKVYPEANADTIARICKFWALNDRNVGVLLNGTRGAGKSMTAKMLGNVLIEKTDLPVLIVRSPIALQSVLTAVQQDLMIIFDEFEKTHDAEHQQKLLSTIDGMSQSRFKRLFVFTTNKTSIDENFKDRPSRIHYIFEFRRVPEAIIEGLISDSSPRVQKHRSEIIDFLGTRKICTIDIVKAVIAEVDTFDEPPQAFENLLNIAKGLPPSYRITVIDPETNNPITTFASYFELRHSRDAEGLFSGNKNAIQNFIKRGKKVNAFSDTWDGNLQVTLLDKCDEPGMWLAQLGVPRSKTHFANFSFLWDARFLLDNPPEDWKFTYTPASVIDDAEARDRVQEIFNECSEQGTVYGTGKPATFKILIEPNKDDIVRPTKYSVNGDWSLLD